MGKRVLAGVCAVVLAGLTVVGAGEVLSRPLRHEIGSPPVALQAQAVQIPYADGQTVAGWRMRGRPGAGALLLLHGVRADRTEMLARAGFLVAEGYSVLLVDLPAHGQSSGDRISFGVRESQGVAAALRFLRAQWPAERVGVIGVSLGAAALVLAQPSPAPDAVVLESMFPTLTEAVEDRLALRLGSIGPALAPLLLCQLPWRLGVAAAQIRPIDRIATLHSPLLIASGTEDPQTRWTETERLFAAAAQPKELWAVQGAVHQDLHAFDPPAYQAKVLGFLGRHLR